MALSQDRTAPGAPRESGSRRLIQPDGGCNHPFKSSFWCPRRQWFFRDPCPFANRMECENFRRICGGL